MSQPSSKRVKRKLDSYSKRHKIRLLNRETLEDVNMPISLCGEDDAEWGIDNDDACSSEITTNLSAIDCDYSSKSSTESLSGECEESHIGFDLGLGLSDIATNSLSENGDNDYESSKSTSSMSSGRPSPVPDLDDDNNSINENKSETLQSNLKDWALHYNIPNNALSHLLITLNKYLGPEIELPKDARTVMKTPKTIEITHICGGQYWHFGLVNALTLMYNDLKIGIPDLKVNSFKLLVNIDGLPISNSSTSCFWPILISEPTLKKVYLAGCFYGSEKPTSANEFLQQFINELISVMESGFTINDDVVSVDLNALICDVPAKSFLLSIKGHSGYSSCTKCTIHGDYIENRVCFPISTCVSNVQSLQPLERTDESCKDQTDEDFHTGNTIFTDIPNFGLVTNVPLDYLHLVCLGVVKKLLQLWMCGPLNIRLSSATVKNISVKLLSLQGTVPHEFERKFRSLAYWKYWKGCEFRQFLLYTGPIVLSGFLREDVMLNFLSLHVAVKILATEYYVNNPVYMAFSANLLHYFVRTFEMIYGKQYVSHNVHNLLHLTKDVEKYGPLDNFSAFRFESFLYQIKKKIRKGDLPLQQLAKRYIESNQDSHRKRVRTEDVALKNELVTGPLSEDLKNLEDKKVYAIYDGKSFFLNVNRVSDRTVILKDSSIFTVHCIVKLESDGKIVIVGSCNKSAGNVYCLDEFESKDIGIQMFEIPEDVNFISIPLSEVLCKAWCMLIDNKRMAVPLSQH